MATLLMFSINNPGPRSDLHPDDGFLTSNMWNEPINNAGVPLGDVHV